MLSVAAFTGGKDVPSARFRVRQYITVLLEHGISVDEFPAALGCYPPGGWLRPLRPLWAAATLATRVPSIIASWRYEVTLLQREMLSTFVTIEPLTGTPRVLDVDDAIWLHPRGHFAKKLAGLCDLVICGNSFVAENFDSWSRRIGLLPTGVDTLWYQPVDRSDPRGRLIGWCGQSGNLRYVHMWEDALHDILDRKPDTKLLIVSDHAPRFTRIAADRVIFRKWTPEIEVSSIQQMDIGVMPLEDSLWARGKCACKMLTYMACGVPVVVSPVGANREVLALGKSGLAAQTQTEVVDSVTWLLEHAEEARAMGMNGRTVVEQHYSVRMLAPRFAAMLRSVT